MQKKNKTKNCNICMICHSYYPWDPRVRREAECLIEEGYSVDVFCLKDENENAYNRYNGVSIYRIPVKRHKKSGFLVYILEYLAFILLVGFIVTIHHLKKRYKVIQVHTLPDFLVFAALIPKLLRANILLDMHELTPELFMTKYNIDRNSPIIRIVSIIERLCAKFADHILTVSEPIKDIIKSRGISKDKISILMNVADHKLFNPYIYKTERQNSNGRLRLIYHGSISELYDLDVILKAINILRGEFPHIEFHIFGKGTMLDNVKSKTSKLGLEEYVYFHGNIPHENIPVEIQNSNMGIIPMQNNIYTNIAIPTKLLEYVAMECPVIISRSKAVENYFDESCLMFFKSSDAENLAEHIKKLYLFPEEAGKMVENANKKYDLYKWEKVKTEYCDLINRLCQT